MDYDDLVSGQYKLLLEPISYFKFKGVQYAMTATEAALFDVKVAGQLKLWMGKLTHQSQPFSMFLERPDLGIQPWNGGTTGKQSNIDILNFLGVGIVSFDFEGEVPPPSGDYVYRTDTDVITSVLVHNNGRYAVTPDEGAVVTFNILGRDYSVRYVCPPYKSQMVWVNWHTPDTPQTVDIGISISGAPSAASAPGIQATVVALEEKEPPDPTFYDTNPGLKAERPPDWGTKTSATWSEWVPMWVDQPGTNSKGYWNFLLAEYAATLIVDYDLQPDTRVKTEIRTGAERVEMKSGYGVNASCTTRVSGDGAVSNYDVTPVQNVLALFPEFKYQTYNRLLQTDRPGYYQNLWQFKPSRYSYYAQPVHFTPLWYPDKMAYTVPLAVFDAWTPGGQLYATVSDNIEIDGSIYDDWYIRVMEA